MKQSKLEIRKVNNTNERKKMKKLVCIGGGEIPRYKNGIILPYETKEIDEEIVKLSNKENPKFLFISIASSHPKDYFEGIKKYMIN